MGDRRVTDPSALLENPSSARLVQVIGPHILKETLPGYKPGITVDEYLSARIQEEVGVDVAKLKPEEQRVLLDEARKKLSREAGVPVEPNDRIDDVFSRIVLGRAKGFIEPYAKFLPIALAVGLFFFLRTAAYPYSWVIILIVWGIMRLFRRLDVIEEVETEAVQRRVYWS